MLEFVYTIISLALIFLLGSVFGERDAIYGYILIPLMGLVFWSLGWLPDLYVSSIIPLVIGLAVVTFLREQFRMKFAGGGSASSLIWKIMAFMVFLQFALVFVNGIASFQGTSVVMATANTSSMQTYTLTGVQNNYGDYTYINAIDQITVGLTLVWTAWNVTWAMIFGMLNIYPNLVTIFHMHPMVAWVVSAGFYIMIAIEVFVLIMFRTRPPEV
jgi:hypothetical protein